MPRLFALDRNFPQPIVSVLSDFQADATLTPLDRIDPRMSTLDDWELLLALHHHADPWDGLITTDTSMLAQGPELATLIQTKLTLVVAVAAGHNPVKASGLLFAYLAGICQRRPGAGKCAWLVLQAGLLIGLVDTFTAWLTAFERLAEPRTEVGLAQSAWRLISPFSRALMASLALTASSARWLTRVLHELDARYAGKRWGSGCNDGACLFVLPSRAPRASAFRS
jgi:hypothetical protein